MMILPANAKPNPDTMIGANAIFGTISSVTATG